jgi:hypothetical protein
MPQLQAIENGVRRFGDGSGGRGTLLALTTAANLAP